MSITLQGLGIFSRNVIAKEEVIYVPRLSAIFKPKNLSQMVLVFTMLIIFTVVTGYVVAGDLESASRLIYTAMGFGVFFFLLVVTVAFLNKKW